MHGCVRGPAGRAMAKHHSDHSRSRISEEVIRQRIRDSMGTLDVSIKQLAVRLKVAPNTLTKRLSEGSFPVHFLDEIAEALGLSLAQLMCGGGSPNNVLWDPIGEEATEFYRKLEPHEAKATTGTGFFR